MKQTITLQEVANELQSLGFIANATMLKKSCVCRNIPVDAIPTGRKSKKRYIIFADDANKLIEVYTGKPANG